MLLFRSEEQVQQWCDANGLPRGDVLSLEQVWRLSQAWYGDRLSPAFRGRTIDDVMQIFDSVGLTSTFWKLPH